MVNQLNNLKARIYKADTPNLNGVVYPREELEKAVQEFNKKVHFATLDKYPPKDDIVKAVGVVSLEMQDDYVVANISEIAGGPLSVLETLSEIDPIIVMPVATGTCDEKHHVNDMSISVICVTTRSQVDITDDKEMFYIFDGELNV